ncbi:MAG TPA: hypothetical protein VLA17_13015, partial [Candidatus Limnocylindria bacterium]|nr:hypothetical protein [Candidatus Limnocylindria bacterium]
MSPASDALTVALTGQFLFVLIAAAIFALVVSLFLLHRYRRAVIRSMRRRSRQSIAEPTGYMPPDEAHAHNESPLAFRIVTSDAPGGDRKKDLLYRQVRRRPWLAALVYAVAGCAFAATMTAAFLWSSGMEFLPFRFAYLTWANAWPVVLTINLVAAISRRAKIIVCAVYLLGGGALGIALFDKSPDITVTQLGYLWFNANAIPSVLLLIFLNRRIRAVGPLVMVFMLLGVAGASLAVTLTGRDPKLLRAISNFAASLGLGATATFWGLHLLGFFIFAVIGWLALGGLRRMYERKQLSERSINLDTIWLLYGMVNSIPLVFQGPRWIVSGFAAFAVFKIVAGAGFGLLRGRSDLKTPGPRLMLLRVFALGRRSEALYDAVGKCWRTVGSVQLIAGPDLATSAVEPHEFLDFLSGKLARRFIDSGATLDLRMTQMDLLADRDGQFRVSEFFCHDDTWKLTLARLADESDVVLMDLRGFSQTNDGCIFEIHELFNLVPLHRLVFALDGTTDEPFLRRTMERAWRQLRD